MEFNFEHNVSHTLSYINNVDVNIDFEYSEYIDKISISTNNFIIFFGLIDDLTNISYEYRRYFIINISKLSICRYNDKKYLNHQGAPYNHFFV